jgi:hypothetical protein
MNMTETTIRLKPGIAAAHYRLSTQVLITGRLTRMSDTHHITLWGYEYQFTTSWLGTISLDAVDFEIVGEATR